MFRHIVKTKKRVLKNFIEQEHATILTTELHINIENLFRKYIEFSN